MEDAKKSRQGRGKRLFDFKVIQYLKNSIEALPGWQRDLIKMLVFLVGIAILLGAGEYFLRVFLGVFLGFLLGMSESETSILYDSEGLVFFVKMMSIFIFLGVLPSAIAGYIGYRLATWGSEDLDKR